MKEIEVVEILKPEHINYIAVNGLINIYNW